MRTCRPRRSGSTFRDRHRERHRAHRGRRRARVLRRPCGAGRRPDRRGRRGLVPGPGPGRGRGDRRGRDGGDARPDRPALPHRGGQGVLRPSAAVGVAGAVLVPVDPGPGRRDRVLGRGGQLHRIDQVRRDHGQRHVPAGARPGPGRGRHRHPGRAVQRRRPGRAPPGHAAGQPGRLRRGARLGRRAGSRSGSGSSGCRWPPPGCSATPGPWPTTWAPASTCT